MEVRGNTYCAASVNKNSKYKWTPQDGNGQDWNRAYFWIMDNKFGGWADGVTPSPIAFPAAYAPIGVPQNERISINGDGWLIEKMNVTTLPPPNLGGTVYLIRLMAAVE